MFFGCFKWKIEYRKKLSHNLWKKCVRLRGHVFDRNKNEQHEGIVHGHANEDGCLQVNDRQLINFSVLGEENVS